MGSCFPFYSGLHNGPDGPQYQGNQQDNTKQAPKKKNHPPLQGLPRVENQPPNRLFGSYPFHTYMGTYTIFLILVAISVIA
jgi:hypothetical protein